MMRFSLLLAAAALAGSAAFAQTVRFETNMGNIDVLLLPSSAPKTVQNFLNYVNKGAYDNSFFHRSVKNFVIQGGGFKLDGSTFREIPQDAPVQNEFRLSNTRGTIAMAKLGGDPNSATNQFFFNTSNNAAQLNGQNGGFTVFGRVANDDSLAVMDRIAALNVYSQAATNGAFDTIPLQNYTSGPFLNETNLVLVKSIKLVEPDPAVSSGGIVTVVNFGGFQTAAPGSLLEIYGTNLATATRQWATADFNGAKAPTALEGTSVTIDGKAAPVAYVSPTQVNVQVPAGVSLGTVPVVVTTNGKSTQPANITIRATAGGVLAPPLFKLNDRQFVAAIHSSSGQFVSNGYIGEFPAAPAKRGETLLIYGLGFGPVESGEVAGQIAGGAWRVQNPVEFRFGDVAARVDYAGLTPNLVGLYQFNVVVPDGAPSGDVPLRVLQGGQPITQSPFITVE